MSTLCSGKLKKKETHKLENEAIKVIEALEKQMHKRNTNYATSIEEGNSYKTRAVCKTCMPPYMGYKL